MQIKKWRRRGCLRTLVSAYFLGATACSAANSITGQPVVSALTYSTARITWVTSENSNSVIRWDADGPPYTNATTAVPQSTRAHAWFLSGLKSVTTYHFAVCSKGADGMEVCSEDQTFTTTEKGDTGPLPPIEVDVTMPPSRGTELFVGPNCDDPTTGLVARWNEASWGDTVVIPVMTRCTGNYAFPAKAADTEVPHRWIITRSSRSNELPPLGSRIDPATDGAKMARLQTNRPTTLNTDMAGLPVACEAGSYAWVTDDSREFKLQQCRQSPTALTIASGSGLQVPLSVTIPDHRITPGSYVHVEGVTGNTNANGTFQANVTGLDTLQLNYLGWRSWPGNGRFDGGILRQNTWQPVSFSTAASLPETCIIGDWFLLQGPGSPLDRAYRCLEENLWTRQSLRGSLDLREGSAIDLSANESHHLRFIGLEITSILLPPEPLWLQMSVDPLRRQPGSVFFNLVYQSESNHHIVWDRCWVHGHSDRSRQWYGFNFDGAHVAVIDSVVNDLFVWSGVEPASLATEANSSAFFIPKGPGPLLIENTFIEAGGVSLYVPSDRCCSGLSEPNDGTIRRNTFHVGDEWRYGSSSFGGKKVTMRHLLELKQGRRWLVEGNTFDGTFTTLNQAAAIALTPRGDGGYFPIFGITDGVVRMNPLFGNCPIDTQVDDWVAIFGTSNNEHNTGWKVTAVSDDRCSITLADISGTSAGGNLQIMTNRRSLTDINVRSNTFKNVANGIVIIGHTDGSGLPMLQLETARRIRIHNNLFQGIDGNRANSSDTSGYPNGLGGYPLYVSLGMEDLHFTHNTVVMSTPGPSFAIEYDNACAPNRSCNPHSGLIYENNIVQYGSGVGTGAIQATGTLYGLDALNGLWRSGDDAGWSYRKNIIATRGTLPTTRPFGPYPANNHIHDLNGGELPFVNPSTGDFRLRERYRAVDNCYGRNGDCSTDGTDVGVNFDELRMAQQGKRSSSSPVQ